MADEMHAIFKKIRNSLRKYDAHQVVEHTIQCIRRQELEFVAGDGVSKSYISSISKVQPWNLYLLLKWAFMHGDFSSYRKKVYGESSFAALMSLFYEISGKVRRPSEYHHEYIFFRNLAYQQFWLQEGFDKASVGRQIYLFYGKQDNSLYAKSFSGGDGETIDDAVRFIVLSIVHIFSKFANPQYEVIDLFRKTSKLFSIPKFSSFMGKVSLPFDDIRGFLVAHDKKRKVFHEYYERTPFMLKPYIKNSDTSYEFISGHLVFKCFEDYVYDALRRNNSQEFMNKFGMDFQLYVERLIKMFSADYLTEKQLQEEYGCKEVVDFCISDKCCDIYIDAKGVEMRQDGMVTHLPRIISSVIEKSIIKGVRQAVSTREAMNAKLQLGASRGYYVLVVVYKEHFIGDGLDLKSSIGEDDLSKRVPGVDALDLSRVFTVSISDFEYIANFLHTHPGYSIVRLLEYMLEKNAHPDTKKFLARQHVFEIDPGVKPPEWIVAEFDRVATELVQSVNG